MREKVSLLEVCRLPDEQLHSRKALFKAVVARETPEAQELKQQIVSLSYTVKTIGVQGEEVGIASRRVPLKLHKKQDYHPPSFLPPPAYLPHQSFFAEALVPVHRPRPPRPDPALGLEVVSGRGTISIEGGWQGQGLRGRTKSTGTLRRFKRIEEDFEELGRIKGVGPSLSIQKKSFSGMLRECSSRKDSDSLNPILHEQNPLFKKITRIKSVYPSLCSAKPESPFRRPRHSQSSSTALLRQYREQL